MLADALPPDVAAGSAVRADPFDPLVGRNPLTLVFSRVSAAANVSLEISSIGPALPEGFAPATEYFHVSATATLTGRTVVCAAVDSGAPARLLHFQAGAWVDITAASGADGAICGTTRSLGTFTLGVRVSDSSSTSDSTETETSSPHVSNIVTWNVDADGFWDDAANWSGGVVPADGDTVVIDRPAGSFVVTVRTTTANVLSVSATEQLAVTGSLVIAGSGSFDGGLVLSGSLVGTGMVTLAGSSSWRAGSASIISIAGGVDVMPGGLLTLDGNPCCDYPFRYLVDSSLRNYGTVVWTFGTIVLRNTSTVTNDTAGVWDVQGDHTITSDGSGTPAFANLGTLRKSVGTGPLTLGGGVTYINSGTIDLQTGMIVVAGPSQLTTSGPLQLASSTTFFLDHVTLLASSTFAGAGLLHANGVTTVPGDLTVTLPLLVTNVVTGTGALHLAASTTWQAGSNSVISLTGGVDVMAGRTLTLSGNPCCDYPYRYLADSSLRNHGSVVWSYGTLILRNSSTVTNEAAGVWDVQGDHTITSDGSGTPAFTNLGTLRKSVGTGPLTLGGGVVYTNSGTIDLQTGTIVVAGPSQLTTSGPLQLASSTTFFLDHVTLLASSTFAGAGLLHANGVTTVPGDLTVTLPLLVTNVVTGTGALHLAASTTWQAGSNSVISLTGGVDVMAGRTLTLSGNPCCDYPYRYLVDSSLRNHGTVVWTFGALVLRNTSTVTNDTAAVWDVQGDHTITSDGSGTPAFANLGTLRKSVGTGPLTLGGGVTYINSGTIDLQTGTIVVAGPSQLTTSGPLQLASSTTFFLDHVTLLASSTFAGAGLLHANGVTTVPGDLTVTLPLLVTNVVTGTGALHLAASTTWQAGSNSVISLTGGVDVMAGRTLTLSGNPCCDYPYRYLVDSSLRNHGTVVWTFGTLVLRNTSTVTNEAAGVWDVQGDHTITSDGSGTPAFANLGTLRKSVGTGPLTLGGGVVYTNSGTIDLQTGTIVVAGPSQLTTSGPLQLASSTTFFLDHVTLLASSTFAGAGLLHANGVTTVPGDLTVTLPLLVTNVVTGTGALHLAASTTWQAGSNSVISLTGGVDVMAGRTLTLSGNPCCDYPYRYLVDSSLRNHGTVVWTFGALVLRNTSTITNEADGVLEVQNNLSVVHDGSGTPAFVNDGVLLRSGAPNRLTVTPPFTNTGTFHVRIGGAGAGQLDEFGGSTVNLGGTLSAQLINGFNPASGDQFKVMDYSSISATFATLTGAGFTFSACYMPNALFVCDVITEKITPTITWANPADIQYGTALSATQLNALASVPGTFAYSPGAGTILNAGNGQVLQLTFTPTDTVHFNTATASVLINVVRATPAITWANPANIVYGTPLSSTQLNATANVAGTFLYTPGAGAVLHAGNSQLLTAAFTPADTANYEPVNAAVAINVLGKPLTVAAVNAMKVFGAPLPLFTASFSGFVNGDTPASLAGTLLLSTTATAASPAGLYPITASGVSSPDYLITFQPGTLTIAPAATLTTLYVLPATTGFLQPVVLVAVMTPVAPGAGVPDGAVQFMDGTTVLGQASVTSGVAFLFVNGLVPGAHSMTAVYAGGGNFSGSTSAPGATTVRPLANSTFTLLFPTANPQAVGQPATLVALVLPLAGGTPTGTVQFNNGSTVIGTAAVVGGIATINPTTLPAGTHLLTARYLGNATFAPSSTPPAAQTVYAGPRPAATAVTLAASPNPSTLGQTITFTATVTGGATTGGVNFYADGLLLGQAPIANIGGSFKATLTTSALSTGTHVLAASYIGSAGFASSSSLPAVQTVQ